MGLKDAQNLKHENGQKAIPGEGDQAQGSIGGNFGNVSQLGRKCRKWISREEGLLGRGMETQRPEVMP